MTRTLAAAVNSYISEPVVRFYTLAEMVLDSGTIRTFNGAGYLTVGANTYVGVGGLGRVSVIQEDINRFPKGVTLQLAAVASSSLLAEVMGETLFNRQVTLYRCWYNPASLSVVNTPERWFRGRINEVNLNRGDSEFGDNVEVTVLTRLKREGGVSYYTQQDMMVGPYSGDTFFNFTDQIPNQKALWGQQATFYDGGPPGPQTPTRRHPRQPAPRTGS